MFVLAHEGLDGFKAYVFDTEALAQAFVKARFTESTDEGSTPEDWEVRYHNNDADHEQWSFFDGQYAETLTLYRNCPTNPTQL